MRTRLLALIGVLTLLVTACGAATPTAEPASEGIQVHGDWTLEIYNEDGTLDREVEFSNALEPDGQFILAHILAGTGTNDGVWAIELDADGPVAPCDNSCRLVSPADLDVSVALGPARVLLSGEASADSESTVASVRTRLRACDPAGCGESPFSSKDLTVLDWNDDGTPNDGPIPVNAGQIVQVTVEISFS